MDYSDFFLNIVVIKNFEMDLKTGVWPNSENFFI